MTLAARVLDIASSRRMLDDIEHCGQRMHLDGEVRRVYWSRAQEKLDGLTSLGLAMPDREDEEDLLRSLAAMWLELRFEWHRHNQVANYGAVRLGEGDPLEVAAGAFCSGVLDKLEGLVGPEAMERLNDEATALLDRTLEDLRARVQTLGGTA